MEFVDMVTSFSYPVAIIASYISISLVKRYTKIETKYHMILAIVTGIIIVILEEMTKSPVTIHKLVSGALSGVIATICFETIEKIISNRK